jgi:hypothetical protein
MTYSDDESRAMWVESLPAEWRDEVANGGSLAAFAWPGGYPLYYVTVNGDTICPECANRDTDYGQRPIARDVHWEGEPIACDDCGKDIESAYGDPDDDKEPSEPDEGDITTTDYQHWYQYGKLVLTVGPDEDYEQAVREYMDSSEFWPNVWSISDHGNVCLLTLYE